MAVVLENKEFGRGIFLGDDPAILNLAPENRLKLSAWRHACPRPSQVSNEYGLEWTRRRYDECNFVFSSLICAHAKAKPALYNALTTPVPRHPNEPVGVFEPGAVPESHTSEMSPLSTLWGYALPRVFIEQAGRENNRTVERYLQATDLLDRAINDSETPIELLANLSEAVIYDSADPIAVLGHVLEPGILMEENCYTMYREVITVLETIAPTLWQHYNTLTPRERDAHGILGNPHI